MCARTNFPTIPVSEVPLASESDPDYADRPVILVVDDERIIADTMSVILRQKGYAAMAAYDGFSALEMAALVPPDLLITDVVMPGLSGIELAITFRATMPDCQILLFSGQAATMDLLESARMAGHSFHTLTKPLHPTLMLDIVAKTIRLCRAKDMPVLS